MLDDLGQTITYNKYQVYEIIENYKLMIQMIQHFEGELNETDFKGVAQYGLEAAMPSGKGVVSKALESEVIRRGERFKRISDYINKVNYISIKRKNLTDKNELDVLDYLLDGLSVSAIKRITGFSRQHIDKIRSDVVEKLSK